MDLDTILLWFSWISLVFWSGVLAWCVATIIIKRKKEKQWLESYVPTLKSDIREPEIQSWLTLTEIEAFREEKGPRRGPRKGKNRP